MCQRGLEAADRLAEEGIDAEVIDLRTLAPLDTAKVAESISKTNRLVCVQECSFSGSWGASLIAALVRDAFDFLDGPPLVVGGDETPIPYAAELEAAWMPSTDRIVATARRAME
jgi:pyruvate dehydrogenase E1 component beta subunit